VGELCLVAALSREQSYMRLPISRLSGVTSQYEIYLYGYKNFGKFFAGCSYIFVKDLY
jgi:hypothetical protein